MWGTSVCRAALSAAAFLVTIDAGAVSGTLELQAAVERALAGNPSLALAPIRREAQSGRLEQAGLGPNPQLSITVEDFLGSGLYEGADQAETTLSLAWILERGKRDRRVAAARAGLDMLDVDAVIERLDVAGLTTEAFLKVLNDQERLKQADSALELGDAVVAAVQARVTAGRSPSADLDRVEADRIWLALAREDVEHQLLVSRRELAATWGSSEVDFTQLSGDLYTLPDAGTFESLVGRLGDNPRINRYLTERRLREAELALAQAQARQDWHLQAGVRYYNQGNDAALVAGFQLPLAIRNRNQGRISEARAQATLADSERVATRVQIETTLYALHQALTHDLHRFEAIRDDVLPLAERMVSNAHRAYERGIYGYFDLRDAQLRLLEARASLREEAYSAHLNRSRIESLTGVMVPDAGAAAGGRP
ncbi:MAG: TolC family protein [Pseudomonadales bacterium]